MIKTVSYNDFDKITWEQWHDNEYMLNLFRDFVKNGGNLDLPVSLSDKIKNFHSTLINKTTDQNGHLIFTTLVNEKLVKNPFTFHVDQNTKTVQDIPGYGIGWLKTNEKNYENHIIKGVTELAQNIASWSKIKNSGTKYESIPYSQELRIETRKHPLRYILEDLSINSLYKVVFQISPEYINMWSHQEILDLLNRSHRNEYKIPELASYFYDLPKGREAILNIEDVKTKNEYLFIIAKHAISENNIDYLKKHLSDFNFNEIENNKDNYFNSSSSKLLLSSQSSEMTEFLIKNNVTISASTLSEKLHVDTLDTMLENNTELFNLLNNDPDVFYNKYINPHNNELRYTENSFNIIKLLVNKYKFPLSNYETLLTAHRFTDTTYDDIYYKWFNENGADPRKCSQFISRMISNRAEGLKNLKSLQKVGHFNSFYPDPIFNILDNLPTKDFCKWLEKAPSENFKRYTKEGYPAWWGMSNQNSRSVVFQHLKEFNQLSKNGLSLFYFLSVHHRRSGYDETKFNQTSYINEIEKRKSVEEKYDISGADNEEKNVFHHILQFKEYTNKEIHDISVKFFLNNTTSHVGELLLQEDNNGVRPIELFDLWDTNYHSTLEALAKIIDSAIEDINWKQPLIMNKTSKECSVYEVFAEFAIRRGNKELLEKINIKHDTWQLHHKLDSELTDNGSKNKQKLKL